MIFSGQLLTLLMWFFFSGPIAAPGTGLLAIQSTAGNMVSGSIPSILFAENKARTCLSGSGARFSKLPVITGPVKHGASL